MKLREVLKEHERAVVIVHYRPAESVGPSVYRGYPPPQNPAVNLQVTLNAAKISPSGRLIRFGDTVGDEIIGWTDLDALDVVEILGGLSENGKTVVPILPRGTLEMKHAVER